ncbi:MAG: hypothetical protein JKY54_15235, partial [Flavobacteriales bacterium]|nr:hypothetical protein [Flavobacteriales bacterium]
MKLQTQLFILISILICSISSAQTTIYFEGFDSPDVDMSSYQLYDGSNNPVAFNQVGADYILRNTPASFPAGNGAVTGMTGKAIGCEDVDGAGFFGVPYIKTNAFSISSYSSITLSIRVGAPYGNWASGTRYEGTDGLDVEYRIDGGIWQQAHYFQASGLGPGQHFWYDAAGNGVTGTGDDIGVTATSQVFTRPLTGSGSTMEIRIQMDSQGSHEELVFDDILVQGIGGCTNPDVPSVLSAAPGSICPLANSTLSWTGALNDATLWHIYTGSCGGTQVGTSTTNSFVTGSLAVTTTFYIRGEDGAGCVDESIGLCGSVTVTVSDAVNPTITCPGNQVGMVNGSCNFSLPDYTGLAVTADNCTASPTVTQSPVAGTIVGVGTTNIVLTTTDGSSNTANCNFNVVVTDATNPTITCPGNQV